MAAGLDAGREMSDKKASFAADSDQKVASLLDTQLRLTDEARAFAAAQTEPALP